MTLKARVAKLERRIGHKRAPSYNEFCDAMRLIDRHFKALELPEIDPLCWSADPEEVALMRMAEETGKIAAARDVRVRYYWARGVDIVAQDKKSDEKIMAELEAAFAPLIEHEPQTQKEPRE